MKRAMRVQAMGKKLTLITTAFVLAVSTLTASLPFILSQQVGAVTGSTVDGVSTYQDLKAAFEDPTVGYINLAPKITIQAPEKLVLTRSDIRVNGNDSTIRYTGANPAGWQGLYVLQAYKVKNVQINSLRLAGGDAGMLINGSEVTLKGNTHPLNDNEFGGIEVSRGVGAADNSLLKLEGNVWDESFKEVNGKPAAWVVNGQGQINQSALNSKLTAATHIKSDQTQYYLRPANANIVATNVSNGETFASLPAAIADSDTVSGHVIEVKSSTITQSTTVNKSVTIRGVNNAVITTSGGAKLFTVLANNVVFENLTFNKIDTVDQHFIGVQSDNVTIRNNQFSAQYNLQANLGTTRAIEVSGGVDNLTVSNNQFNNIRQPAYINDTSNGTISNNYVNNTRGWVVENSSDFTFTGNSWGTNAIDIALINGSPAKPNNYTCRVAAMVAANNNARIQDQAPASVLTCPNTAPTVTFNGATPAEGAWVRGTVNASVSATDDYGMGSYYIRYWKNAFELANGGTLAHGCQSAPGAFLLGTSVNANCSFNTASVADGTKIVLSAQFLDGHGAWGSAQRSFFVDNTAPTVTVKTDSTSAVDGTIGLDPYSRISFKLYDAAGNLKEVELNGNVYPRSGKWNDLNWQNINTAHLNQGMNTVIVRDVAGNESQLSFVYDSVAPDAPVLSVTGLTSGATTNQSNVTATWNKPSSDTVKYEYRYWNEIPTSPWNAANPWTVEVTGESRTGNFTEGEGKHFMQVRAFDALNQASPWSNAFEITYDATAPDVQIPNYSISGRVVTPNVTIDDTAASVKWTQTGGSVNGVTISDDEALRPTFTVAEDGTYTYELTATDSAGNETVRTFAFTYATPATSPTTVSQQPLAPTQNQGAPQILANQATTVPAFIGPASQQALGLDTNNTDETQTGSPEVQGTSTEKTLASAIDADNTDGNAMGLAWYWWLLIVAAIALIGWWIAAALRKRSEA